MHTTIRSRRSTRRELLDRLPVVAHVPADGRAVLLGMFEEVTVPQGRVVLHAGETVGHLYLVGSGTVAAAGPDGELALHGPGEPVGLRWLLDGGRLPFDATAVSETELWTMGRREFRSACMDVSGFALGILEAVH
jgi:CRP-like cAMP-binding protein